VQPDAAQRADRLAQRHPAQVLHREHRPPLDLEHLPDPDQRRVARLPEQRALRTQLLVDRVPVEERDLGPVAPEEHGLARRLVRAEPVRRALARRLLAAQDVLAAPDRVAELQGHPTTVGPLGFVHAGEPSATQELPDSIDPEPVPLT